MRGQPVYTPGDKQYAKVDRINISGTGSATVWPVTELRDRTVVRAEVTFSNSTAGTDVHNVTYQHGFASDSLSTAATVATVTGDGDAAGQVDNLQPFVKVDVAPATESVTWSGYVEVV